MTHANKSVSPLRQRMIEDMTMRRLSPNVNWHSKLTHLWELLLCVLLALLEAIRVVPGFNNRAMMRDSI